MKPTVYLETSVISYLAAHPSRDLIVAAHQQITWTWWIKQRHNFDIVVSPMVWAEAQKGNPFFVKKRVEFLSGLRMLAYQEEIDDLVSEYNQYLKFPLKKVADAFHLAYASWHGINFLLTWNCKHITNMNVRRALNVVNSNWDLKTPVLGTPEELEA